MDSISRIKKQLNYDQRNLASGTVISTANATAQVRLNDGTVKTAYIGSNSPTTGELVQISIDGNLCSITGSATLQRRSAEKTVILS